MLGSVEAFATHRLRVEYWPIGRLRPYERNPRKNDKSVDRIRDQHPRIRIRGPDPREVGWRDR